MARFALQFLFADGLITHPLQFLDELGQGAVGHFGANFGAGVPRAGNFRAENELYAP